MRYLIDGYNLLLSPVGSRFRDGARGFEAARNRLLDELAGSVADPERLTIAFDARRGSAPAGDHRVSRHHGLLVLWATGYDTADELIADCCRADPDPGSLVVVSDDGAVRKAARRAKSLVLPCGQFLRELKSGLRGNSGPKPARGTPTTAADSAGSAAPTGPHPQSSTRVAREKPETLGPAETAEWLTAFRAELETTLPENRAERRISRRREPEPAPIKPAPPGAAAPPGSGRAAPPVRPPAGPGPAARGRRQPPTFGGSSNGRRDRAMPPARSEAGADRIDPPDRSSPAAPSADGTTGGSQRTPSRTRGDGHSAEALSGGTKPGAGEARGGRSAAQRTQDGVPEDDFLARFAAEMRLSIDRLQATAIRELTIPERRRGGHAVPKRDPEPPKD